MSAGWQRSLADLVCRVLQGTLPRRLQAWGWAVRHEVAGITDDTGALLFALNSLGGLLPRAMLIHLLDALAALAGKDALSTGGMVDMRFYEEAVRRPRAVGVACAIGSVVLGLAYLMTAGAPMRYLGINAGALVAGLAMVVLASRGMLPTRRWPGAITLLTGTVLLLTALFGDRVEGAARWVQLGPLAVQPSLILLPMMIVGFARSRNGLSMIGLIVAAAAMAIQPDRAMAGVLAAGLSVLAVVRPDRLVLPAVASSIAGFAVTVVRADTLPAMPYVDQILYSSFDVHTLAGLAVLGGSVLLIVPAIVGSRYDGNDRETCWVFGVVWFAAVIAAATGNYPTPIVGYGGSAILGYLLSLIMLPEVACSSVRANGVIRDGTGDAPRPDRKLRVGLAPA